MFPRDNTPCDVKSLVDRFSRGDDAALEILVASEEENLRRWIEKRMPHRLQRHVGASNIIQLTAIELITIQGRFVDRGANAFRKLLWKIARRVLNAARAREFARKRDPRTLPVAVPPAHTGKSETPSALQIKTERIAMVQNCFAKLSDADRQIIHLVDYQKMSYEQVSPALGITPIAARKRYSRAVARLRKLLVRTGIAE